MIYFSIGGELARCIGKEDRELEQLVIDYAVSHPLSVQDARDRVVYLISRGADVEKLKQLIRGGILI